MLENDNIEELAHKNVLLYKLMKKLGFTHILARYDSYRHRYAFSFIANINWKYRRDTLKCLDADGCAHIYRNADWHFKDICKPISFMPFAYSLDVVAAKALFLDNFVADFKHGLKWKDKTMLLNDGEIDCLLVDLDLRLDENDVKFEKTIIDTVKLNDILKKMPMPF